MRPENSVKKDGYLTLNEVPDANARRAFLIPSEPEWFGVFMGALAPLLEENAWRQYGTLTPQECADVWREIFFSNPACGCELPGGSRIIRLNASTGQLEELSDDTGEWETPTGDYAVPPITPREGTSDDIRCLAAANAANVLEILYESITDSIASELEASEAYAALVTAFIAAVGWEFAPIAFALAAFFLAVFAVVYEIIKIIGADLWDSTFTDTLKCALYGCSSADGEGVVTFDWVCAQNALAAGTDALNFDQLRLFNQLNFIIEVIGGADGLNQAGTTTAITDADCSLCNPETETCHLYDPMEVDLDYTNAVVSDYLEGTYDSGIFEDGKTLPMLTIRATWTALVGTGVITDGGLEIFLYSDLYPSGRHWIITDLGSTPDVEQDVSLSGDVYRIVVRIYDKWSGGGAFSIWDTLKFTYDPVIAPFGWSRGIDCSP